MGIEQKKLQNIAMFLGVVILIDAMDLVISLLDGNFAIVTDTDAMVQTMLNGILIGTLAVNVFILLVKAFLVWKGFAEAKNPNGATLHVTIAKALLIINIVMLAFLIAGLFTSSNLGNVVSNMILTVFDTAVMYFYMSRAKSVSLLKK